MASVTIEELRSIDLLGALPDAALNEIAQGARVNRFGAADMIFDKGAEGDSLHLVRSGLIKIVDHGDGKSVTLQTVTPGGVFGELAALDPAPRSAAAIAIDESETIEVSRDVLDRVLVSDPTAARKMLGSMARTLTDAKEQVIHHNEILDAKVRERTQDLRETQLEVVRRLGRAAEFRDDDTGLHITRMSKMAAMLAEALGFTDAECETILHAAPMHDVGKIGIPDNILLKPGKLTDEEFAIMQTHTTIGAEILSGSNSAIMQMAHEIALSHHEKWNGRGYPQGLDKENIPVRARIAAVVDVFDALTSERPYKEAWPFEKAMGLIETEAGEHFDPNMVPAFISTQDEVREMRERAEELARESGADDDARQISAYPIKS